MQQSLVREPLERAHLKRRIAPCLIVHFDLGGQCLSHKMKKLIKAFKLKQSMLSADDPYDNVWAESFWVGPASSRLKAEHNVSNGGYEILEGLKTVLLNKLMGIIILGGYIRL